MLLLLQLQLLHQLQLVVATNRITKSRTGFCDVCCEDLVRGLNLQAVFESGPLFLRLKSSVQTPPM